MGGTEPILPDGNAAVAGVPTSTNILPVVGVPTNFPTGLGSGYCFGIPLMSLVRLSTLLLPMSLLLLTFLTSLLWLVSLLLPQAITLVASVHDSGSRVSRRWSPVYAPLQ